MKTLIGGTPCLIEIDEWKDFHELTGDFLSPATVPALAYLFRGQADAKWPLQTTLSRVCAEIESTLTEDLARRVEEISMLEFEAQAFQFLPAWALPRDANIVERWVVMQHYGAPTRLLDWTASPYVAAYFAVAGEPNSPGAVWALHGGTLLRECMGKYPEAHNSRNAEELQAILLGESPPKPTLMTYRPRIETDRMSAQQTCFTYSPTITPCHSDLLKKVLTEGATPNAFVKIVIPPGKKKLDFLKELHMFNITARSLFPGGDGLGRSITELARLQRFPERGIS